MSSPVLPLEEFFIYVPHGVESLDVESDSEEENVLNHSAHEAWVKISLARQVVVYTHVCGEDETEPLPL